MIEKLSLAETYTILNIKKSNDDELIKYSFLELLFNNILTIDVTDGNKTISKGNQFKSLVNNTIFENFIEVIESNGDGKSLYYFVGKLKNYLSDLNSFKNDLVIPELIDKGIIKDNKFLKFLGFNVLTFKGRKLQQSIIEQLKQLQIQINKSKSTKGVNLSELINSNKSIILLLTPDSFSYILEYQKALNRLKEDQNSVSNFLYHANPLDLLQYQSQYNMRSIELILDLENVGGFLDSLIDGNTEIITEIGDLFLEPISDN